MSQKHSHKQHKVTVIRKYRYVIIAVVAFGAAILINDGLKGITFSIVISRVVEAIGDVFCDRGFDLES